ncbi:MAG: 2OG-Fe(II) oxygenase [Methylacidiphilales bacterium]|nr:2OG-Fe(II) oxygenase [Candidatus Methylacidiphilales bacterium]NJR18124.1 2OG-Fe(II) oxygenase [Calothrix sp. CSU_2_0]
MGNLIKQTSNKILKRLYRIPSLQRQAELGYQEAVKQYAEHLPKLSPEDFNLVETVRREGVVVTSLDALSIPSSKKMFEVSQNLMPQIPRSIPGTKNEYVVHASPQQMMENSEIFLWGLEQRILNIAETYFGLPVAFHGAYFRRDIANNIEEMSRLWHIDIEDLRVLKVIIYLQDVNEENGPFEYIPLSLSKEIAKKLKYRHGYIKNQRMEQALSNSHYQSCTGKAGTVVLAATGSVFHRGKIPVSSDRFALFFDYTSRLPKLSFLNQYSMSPENLHLLSSKVSESQRQSLLWQENGFYS